MRYKKELALKSHTTTQLSVTRAVLPERTNNKTQHTRRHTLKGNFREKIKKQQVCEREIIIISKRWSTAMRPTLRLMNDWASLRVY